MQVADEHTIDLHGKEYTLYPGLLAQAHERGLHSIDEQIVQIPTEENGRLAIVRATVTDKDGRIFTGLGDASPQSVGRNIAPHVLRMASTRAKARAFRDMLGVEADGFDELGDEPEQEIPPLDRGKASFAPATGQQKRDIATLIGKLNSSIRIFERKHGPLEDLEYNEAAEFIANAEDHLEREGG
jgi:hypothetical protein